MDQHQILKTLTPVQQHNLRDCTQALVPFRWNRLMLRLLERNNWHFQGLLLWLHARSGLRYLPFPYPSVSSPAQWKLQAEAMVSQGALPMYHFKKAVALNRFTAGNLKELALYRNRLGLKLSFLEDRVLEGMLAAKAMKGQGRLLKAIAVQEAQQLADQARSVAEKEMMARTLLGPRGGLPKLRQDLIKLAVLLNVDFDDSRDSVAVLQTKIRPTVKLLMAKPVTAAGASSSNLPVQEEVTVSSPPASMPPPSMAASMTSWSVAASGQTSGVSMEEVQQLMAQQDHRFQGMLNQVLQHMMTLTGNPLQPVQQTVDLTATPDDDDLM